MDLINGLKNRGYGLKRVVASLLTTCFLSFGAYAVPAKPGVISFDNGGKSVDVYLIGDENSHYYATTDGYMIVRGEDGLFRYALPDGNRLKTSNQLVSNPQERSIDEVALLESFNKQSTFAIKEAQSAKIAKKRIRTKIADESYLNTFPTKGSPRCLAVLVEFQDVKFTLSEPSKLFNDMLNKEGFNEYGATGSVKDFFEASSGGQFTPQFDVYGPVVLPNNMSYYGANDKNGNDIRPYEMVLHAVDLLQDEIDFSIYDTDNDGVVDNIISSMQDMAKRMAGRRIRYGHIRGIFMMI